MITIPCPNCGTVTTVGVPSQPDKCDRCKRENVPIVHARWYGKEYHLCAVCFRAIDATDTPLFAFGVGPSEVKG